MSYITRLVFGLGILIYSVSGLAVGLGDLKTHSSLNEPFDARVEIINLGDLDPDQIRVKLASAEDFARVGTAREVFLQDLEFSVDMSNPHKPAIKITSTKAAREPYLDFLVELKWPAGRILRGYTVFLDLPVFANKASPTLAASTRTPVSRAAGTPGVSSAARTPSATATADGGDGSGSYRVRSGDTLWAIAERSRPTGSSVQQAMTAIHDRNLDAFVNGNMNRLRQGALLTMPDAHAISSVDGRHARTQVARAVEDLQARNEVPELVTSDDDEAPAETTDTEGSGGVLTLAPPDVTTTAESGAGEASEPAAIEGGISQETLENELAIAEEKLAQAEQQNQMLSEQLARQRDEIAKMSRLLELEGNELAAIQQGIEPAVVDQAEGGSADAGLPSSQSPEQPSLFAGIRDKLTLIAGGLLILILGVLFLLSRGGGKSRGATPMSEVQADLQRGRTREVSAPAAATAAAVARASELESEPVPNEYPVADADDVDADGSDVDPVGEADIYLSFGDHAEAEAVIRRGLETNPQDSRLHLKLLDIFAAQGDVDRFEEHYPELVALADREAIQGAERMRESLIGPEEEVSGDDDMELVLDLDAVQGEDRVEESDTDALMTASPEEQVETQLLADIGDQDQDPELLLDLPAEETIGETADARDENLDPDHDLVADEQEESPDLALNEGGSELEASLPELDVVAKAPRDEAELGDLELDLEEFSTESEEAASFDFEDFEDDLDALVGGDEVATQLELAQAYVDMGDEAGAKDILNEVIANGSDAQQSEAQAILAQISRA